MPKNILSQKVICRIRKQLDAPGLSDGAESADIRWARQILAGADREPPGAAVRPEVILALVDELTTRKAGDTLACLAAKNHRTVAKAARTALHRLRSSQKMDVEVPTQHHEGHTGTGQVVQQAIPSLQSIYDSSWDRLVWLGVEELPLGVQIYQTRISAVHGLMDFRSGVTSRRDYRSRIRKVLKELGGVQINAETAAWFIEQAAMRCKKEKRALPLGYIRSSQSLGQAPKVPHPALAIEPATENIAQRLDLFELPELAYWTPGSTVRRVLSLRLQEITTSRLVINEAQRQEQMRTAIDRVLREFYTPERCQGCYQVLLDTAHILSLKGDARRAAQLRAAADIYLRPVEAAIAHPFARWFVERLIREKASNRNHQYHAEEEQQSQAGLILPG